MNCQRSDSSPETLFPSNGSLVYRAYRSAYDKYRYEYKHESTQSFRCSHQDDTAHYYGKITTYNSYKQRAAMAVEA